MRMLGSHSPGGSTVTWKGRIITCACHTCMSEGFWDHCVQMNLLLLFAYLVKKLIHTGN